MPTRAPTSKPRSTSAPESPHHPLLPQTRAASAYRPASVAKTCRWGNRRRTAVLRPALCLTDDYPTCKSVAPCQHCACRAATRSRHGLGRLSARHKASGMQRSALTFTMLALANNASSPLTSVPKRAVAHSLGSLSVSGGWGWSGVPNDGGGVEDRAIDADAFHGRAVGSIDKHGAARAASDRAGHEFLE